MHIYLTCDVRYVTRLSIVSHRILDEKFQILQESFPREVFNSLGLVLDLRQVNRLLDDLVVVWRVLPLDRRREELVLVLPDARIDDVLKNLVQSRLLRLLTPPRLLLLSRLVKIVLVVIICQFHLPLRGLSSCGLLRGTSGGLGTRLGLALRP